MRGRFCYNPFIIELLLFPEPGFSYEILPAVRDYDRVERAAPLQVYTLGQIGY
jgi:hypothetical protein